MDKNSKLLTVIVVVIVLAAACIAAAYTLTSDNNDAVFQTDSVAQVYGNANMDYTIDGRDVEYLQSIVNGDTNWNAIENPFADSNNDGRITQDDIDLVNKIINKEECTVFYYDYWGNASPLNYPIVNPRIAVTYWQQAEEMGILGLWDNIVVANNSVFTSSSTSIYDTSGIVSIGTSSSSSSSVDDAGIETMMENDVDLIIASCYTAIKDAAVELETLGIQSIFLWHAGSYCLSTILTLGVLLDQEENAQEYVAYCDGIVNTINDRLDGVERPTGIIVMMYENEDNYISSNSGITTLVNDPEGAWYLIGEVLDVYTATPTNVSLGRAFYSEEWFMENDNLFDYIIQIEESTGLDGTKEKYNSRFDKNVEYFSNTDAYSEGNIVGTTYAFGGFAGYSLLMQIAWMVYPDHFTEEEALDSTQFYYDNFTTADIDVTERAYYYTGDNFVTNYMRD